MGNENTGHKDDHMDNMNMEGMSDHEHMHTGHNTGDVSKNEHTHMEHDNGNMSGHQAMEHDMGSMHAGHDNMADHSGHGSHHAMMVADFRRRFWISLIITIPILILSPLIQKFLGIEGKISFTGESYVLFVLSSAIFFYGGWPFLKGIYSELKSKSPGMMTLIALAITVAYVYSSAVVFGLSGSVFFWELATLIDVMLLGHWLEMRSIMSASSALEELARLMPSEAHKVMPDGNIKEVPLDELKIDDTVLVKPGEKIPADGIVIDGETSVNESMLTGESVPVHKLNEATVIGGSVNGEGSITIEVKKTGEDSYLSQMTELVRQAQESKSRTQNLANRAALWLTIIAISAGLITLVVWLGVAQSTFVFALSRMVTVMVITCPHALGLAIPLVVSVSTSVSAKAGLLIKNRDGFEQARNVQAILFDKTGTLTRGEFGVTDIIALNGKINEKEILKYAASVEAHSEHPIARGIVISADDTFPVEEFTSIPGKGAQGKVNGKEVKTVSPGYLIENGINVDDNRIENLSSQGKTVIFVMINGELMGAIALADIIRGESKEAIAQLKGMGIQCMMITGDNELVAKWVAEETGLDEYFAGVLPDKKAEKVKEVQDRGLIVAMTGDGVNDAPALAQADIGIAIGAGTDVAVASADIVLVRSNPRDVTSIINLSKATYKKMLQNLAWATGYNVIAIPLAAGVAYGVGFIMDPAVGAALMALSTIIVAINARFLRVEKGR
ncbi:MAG: copper-translocating P-type ATPase [Dehalococcoidales bacterium]|nr:copper-translocating P-type ATPase [Dehalococcoidales bacterium]